MTGIRGCHLYKLRSNSTQIDPECHTPVFSLPDIVEVESDWQLEVKLYGGTLVGPPQGVHDDDVNL